MNVRLSPLAQRDLDEIWDYSADRWGKDQANNHIAQIRKVAEELASTAARHPTADELAPGLRKSRAGTHVLYYLVRDDIEVIRILHVRRDAGPLVRSDQ